MSKSIIPFIFENPTLNNIFIEASISKNMSKMFNFQIMDLQKLKTKKYKIVITDDVTLKKILDER